MLDVFGTVRRTWPVCDVRRASRNVNRALEGELSLVNCTSFFTFLPSLTWHSILIRIDSAEGKILSRCRRLREYIEESGFSDVWDADDADLQIRSNAADQRLHFGDVRFLRGHREIAGS